MVSACSTLSGSFSGGSADYRSSHRHNSQFEGQKEAGEVT